MPRAKPIKPLSKERAMEKLVEQSVSSIKKKGMSNEVPALLSEDGSGIDMWSKALLSVAGPKKEKELTSFFATLHSAVYGMGNFGYKLPNPDVSTRPFFVSGELMPPERGGVICPGLLPLGLIYSGNSGQIRKAKFLMARLSIDGRATNVLQEMLSGAGPVVAALERAGMPAATLKQVASAFESRGDPLSEPIHALTKQVFFEEEGHEDMLLLPIISESMISTLRTQSQKEKQWLPTMICAVGGTKPINGGNLCCDIAGKFSLVMADAPGRVDSTLAARLSRNGKVFSKYSINEVDVHTFVANISLTKVVASFDRRNTENRLYEWFAQVLAAPVISADELIDAGVTACGERAEIGAYLQRDRSLPVSEELAQRVAAEIIEVVAKGHKDFVTYAANETVQRVLIAKLTEVLRWR